MTTPHDGPVTPDAAPTAPAPGGPAGRMPFADVPVRDYVTDAAALVLLCVSIGLAWSFHDRASHRVDVVLASTISVASLAVTYVVRARVGSLRTGLRVRAWLGVPYALVVIVALAVDGVSALDFRVDDWSAHGGLGPALGVGLAGAALAVAPRAAESADAALAATARRLARSLLGGLLAAVVVVQVIALVAIVVFLFRFSVPLDDAATWVSIAGDVVLLVLEGALVGVPLLLALRGSAPWRWVLVAVAATTVVLLAAQDSPLVTTLPAGSGGAALVLAPAAGAVALGAAVAAGLRPVEPPVRLWTETARAAWLAIAGAAGALVVLHLLQLVERGLRDLGVPAGRVVAYTVLDAAIVALAVVAWVLVGRSGIAARTPALWLTGGMFVLGCAVLVIYGTWHPVLRETILAVGLPLLAAIALTAPEPVRQAVAAARPAEWFADLSGGGAPSPTLGAPAPVAPVAPVPDESVATAHGFTAAQAADPTTDLAVLAAIVERAPELRPVVAANPSTYPDLLAWLAQLHDPAVDAALASRRG